jgi:hypothetical protein
MTNEVGMVFPSISLFRNVFNFTGILLYHYLGKFLSGNEYSLSKPKFLFTSDLEKIFPNLNPKY